MLASTDSNVKFTDEQQRQLEAFRVQSENLQAEITVNSNTLRGLLTNVSNATKEYEYLVLKKGEMEKSISLLDKQCTDLKNSVQESSKQLETDQKESEKIKNYCIQAKGEIDKEKENLEKNQKQFYLDKKELDKIIIQNNQDKEEIAKKKALIADLGGKL